MSERDEKESRQRGGERRLFTRRRFLKLAATLPLLGAAGCSTAKAAGKKGLSLGEGATSTTGTSSGPRPSSSPTSTTATTLPPDSATAGRPIEAGIDPEPVTVLQPGETAPGYIFLTPGPMRGRQEGPLIVDDNGEVVWFWPLKSPLISTNLQVQSYRGEPVLAWWQGINIKPGYGQGHYIMLDSSYRPVAEVYGQNGLKGDLHEFFITPEGTALFTCYRLQPADLSKYGGSRHGTILNSLMQEVDIATGKLLFQWDAAQHVPMEHSEVACPKRGIWDWFHINSIDVDTDGNLLISSRHLWSVFKVDRSNGKVIWTLNGKGSDFKIEKGAFFSWQHTVRHQANHTMSIFDDGAGPRATEKESRGLILNVDTTRMVASLNEQYLPTPRLLSGSQGSVQILPDGHVFVGWGAYPYYSEYLHNATLIYNARLPPPSHSYRAYRYVWTGRPTTPPELTAKSLGRGRIELSASWNGATEVAHWLVLAGASESSLQPVHSFSFDGFVTTMELESPQKVVAVEALSASGSSLGRSVPVTL